MAPVIVLSYICFRDWNKIKPTAAAPILGFIACLCVMMTLLFLLNKELYYQLELFKILFLAAGFTFPVIGVNTFFYSLIFSYEKSENKDKTLTTVFLFGSTLSLTILSMCLCTEVAFKLTPKELFLYFLIFQGEFAGMLWCLRKKTK